MKPMTMKSRSSRPGDPAAGRPRPVRPRRPCRPTRVRDSAYLRRWVAHQAATYADLLESIAAAPSPHGMRPQ